MHHFLLWLRRRRGRGGVSGFFVFLVLAGITCIARATVLYTEPFRNRLLVQITIKFGKTAARIVCAAFGAALMALGIWGIVQIFRQNLQRA